MSQNKPPPFRRGGCFINLAEYPAGFAPGQFIKSPFFRVLKLFLL